MSEEAGSPKPSLFKIITHPTEQFERIKERPVIWVPMLIIIVLFIIGTWLTTLNVEIPEVEGLDPELAGDMQAFAMIGAIIGGIIGPLLSVLVATVIFLLIAKIAQSPVSFKQLFSMNTHIMIIAVLSLIVNGIIMLLIGGVPGVFPTSLGSIIHVEGAAAGIFNNIEIFTIWSVIISAIGLQKVADFSKGLAWSISIAFYIISIIFAMIGAGFSGMTGM